MQNSTDGFMLGIKELELYDNLIKQYINFGREFVSPEDIDSLFLLDINEEEDGENP